MFPSPKNKKNTNFFLEPFFSNLFFLGARGFARFFLETCSFFPPFGGVLAVFFKQTIQTIQRWWFFLFWIDPELLETTSMALDAVAIAERYPKSTHHLKGREVRGAFLDVWEVGCHMASKRVWYRYNMYLNIIYIYIFSTYMSLVMRVFSEETCLGK